MWHEIGEYFDDEFLGDPPCSSGAIFLDDLVKWQPAIKHFCGGFRQFQTAFIGQLAQAKMDGFRQINFPRNDSFALRCGFSFPTSACRFGRRRARTARRGGHYRSRFRLLGDRLGGDFRSGLNQLIFNFRRPLSLFRIRPRRGSQKSRRNASQTGSFFVRHKAGSPQPKLNTRELPTKLANARTLKGIASVPLQHALIAE